MTNEQRLGIIVTTATAGKMCVDEGNKKGLLECLWDIEALIDSGGIRTLRPILDRCKGQNDLNNMDDVKKSLDILGTKAERVMNWW